MSAWRSPTRWGWAATTARSSSVAGRTDLAGMGRDDRRRAVVTGMGAITPIGNDVATFWSNLTAGVSGVARIASYDPSAEEVQIAAEIKGFDPATWMDFKQARRMSRFSQIAVACAAQAIADSGLEITDANRDEIAVIVNTGGGGIGDVANGERVFLEQGGKRVSPSWCRCSRPR